MKSLTIILLLLPLFGFSATKSALNKELCKSSFSKEDSYIKALINTKASYKQLVEFYQNDCGYNYIYDKHSRSEDIIRLHSELETDNQWQCIPVPYRYQSYTNLFKFKRIGNTSFCFENIDGELRKYRVHYQSRFEESKFRRQLVFGLIPQKYPIDYEFELLDYEVKEVL